MGNKKNCISNIRAECFIRSNKDTHKNETQTRGSTDAYSKNRAGADPSAHSAAQGV